LPTIRQSHIGGERMFVDYTGTALAVIDGLSGEARTAQLFVALLGSRRCTPRSCATSRSTTLSSAFTPMPTTAPTQAEARHDLRGRRQARHRPPLKPSGRRPLVRRARRSRRRVPHGLHRHGYRQDQPHQPDKVDPLREAAELILEQQAPGGSALRWRVG
jgi:hypothetical protein